MGLEDKIAASIADRYGLSLEPSMLTPLVAQLQPPLVDGDDRSLRDLLSEPSRLRHLAGQLTIGESYFFRHPEQLRTLSAWVAKRRAERGRVTIWSAGCSRGEELYSVAIRLLLDLGPLARQGVVLQGSDLDARAIDTAREGVYSPWSLRGTDELERKRFFLPSDGGMRLVDELRTWPQFDCLSIQERLEQWSEGQLDVVLFRNVGIYLTPTALTEIHRGFARVLADDGLLVQSATDPRPSNALFSGTLDTPVGVYLPARSRALVPQVPVPPNVTRRTDLGGAPQSGVVRRETRVGQGATPPFSPVPTSATDDKLVDSSLEAISLLADRGQLEEAERRLAAYLSMHPRCIDGLLLRGQLALHRGEPRLSVQALRSLLFLAPDCHLGRYWYVVALERAGDSRAATEQLRELRRAETSSDKNVSPMSAELREAIRELAKRRA
jgi:chemotaxis protein methyltransferase CheR